ncbi:unnamed protein product, partial [Mesorhabditis belari]|uniref:Uncharacterized protein n=1 Tax=Mesorhabditis belari TaxID=2138241 RepID=A0AAF3EQ56_9BILA
MGDHLVPTGAQLALGEDSDLLGNTVEAFEHQTPDQSINEDGDPNLFLSRGIERSCSLGSVDNREGNQWTNDEGLD